MFCPSCGTENSEGYNYCRQCGKPLREVTASPSPVPQPAKFAGFWLRFVAHMIDKLVLSIPSVFLAVIAVISLFTNVESMEDLEDLERIEDLSELIPFLATILVIAMVGVLVDWLYRALMESSSWQATLGKRALGIKVTDMNGHRISFLRASGRHFGKILSGLMLSIGFIMAGFTPKKQALHDMIAGTLVVRSY